VSSNLIGSTSLKLKKSIQDSECSFLVYLHGIEICYWYGLFVIIHRKPNVTRLRRFFTGNAGFQPAKQAGCLFLFGLNRVPLGQECPHSVRKTELKPARRR